MKVERRLAYKSSQFMADVIVCIVDSNGNPHTPDSREALKAGGLELEKYSSASNSNIDKGLGPAKIITLD